MGNIITAKEARSVAEHIIKERVESQIDEYDGLIREACADGAFEVTIWETDLVDGTVDYFKDLGYHITVTDSVDPRDYGSDQKVVIKW